ncbi:MAG: HAD-IIA family hydrolase [Variovorax sp.]|nr:HAD-IIA family hydrolase [Variovorax sp.]
MNSTDDLPSPRHLILDLDGTLIREDEPLPGAAELLARYRGRCVIVSNNSTHTARGVARRLARMGLAIEPAHVVLAGESTVAHLRRAHADARILLAASRSLRRHALAQGCTLVEADADLVVLALDPHFNHARLARLANELRRGARLIATNGDDNHPGPGGTLVPETGALLAALTAASGVAPMAVLGKPGPLLFEEGLRRLGPGATRANTIVIGDNPATDLRAARGPASRGRCGQPGRTGGSARAADAQGSAGPPRVVLSPSGSGLGVARPWGALSTA